MTTRNFFTGLLLALLALSLSSPARAQEPPDPAENPAPFDPRFGLVNSFVNTQAATEAGAGWTRVFFRWDVIQPGGPGDWKPTNVPDPFLEAEIEAGRQIVAVLIGTPAWATDSGASTAPPPIEFWGNFVFKIASQYQGQINHWVIWNQPDITDPSSPNYTWAGTEEDYYRLLKEAYLKIKAVDPEMQVHLAGLTYTWDQQQEQPQYLARLLEIIAADPQAAGENYFFDAVSYHLYYDPIRMLEALIDIRAILDANGQQNKPIWINETNAPPTDDFIEPATGSAPFNVTLEEQSAFVIQSFALALAGGADRIAFNKLRNQRNHPESAAPYGLLRGDDSRRPAFNAFQTVTTYFAGVQEASWIRRENIYIVTLDRGGETTTVLWNMDRSPVSYNLNAIAGQGVLVDDQGQRQPLTASQGVYNITLPGAACSNGSYCFIGGPPRLVIETGRPEQRAPLLPLTEPTAAVEPTPADLAVAATVVSTAPVNATPAPPPTLTPTPGQTTATPALTSTPTAPPPAAAGEAPPPGDVLPAPGLEEAPPAGALPDPDFDPAAPASDTINADPTPTIVPPVGLRTILRPDRLLWLFLIGLIVFTVTYGLQVAIWYRLKR